MSSESDKIQSDPSVSSPTSPVIGSVRSPNQSLTTTTIAARTSQSAAEYPISPIVIHRSVKSGSIVLPEPTEDGKRGSVYSNRRSSSPVATFHKTIPSDVDEQTAEKMIVSLNQKYGLFAEFTPPELTYLSSILTILSFQPSEVIIETGEQSSFVGIVVQGQLNVELGDGVVKAVDEGRLLGELR